MKQLFFPLSAIFMVGLISACAPTRQATHPTAPGQPTGYHGGSGQAVGSTQTHTSQRDAEITRRIQERIRDHGALSEDARNIIVITVDGLTTLRGEVETRAERSAVAMIAIEEAGPGNVRNQLEVPQQN